MNLKIPWTIFCLYPFFKYLQIKIPRAIIYSYPFSNIEKKSLLTNLKISWTTLWSYPFFKYLKNILMNLNIPRTIFCLYPLFKYLQISKYLGQLFAYTLFQIFKKHTYES